MSKQDQRTTYGSSVTVGHSLAHNLASWPGELDAWWPHYLRRRRTSRSSSSNSVNLLSTDEEINPTLDQPMQSGECLTASTLFLDSNCKYYYSLVQTAACVSFTASVIAYLSLSCCVWHHLFWLRLQFVYRLDGVCIFTFSLSIMLAPVETGSVHQILYWFLINQKLLLWSCRRQCSADWRSAAADGDLPFVCVCVCVCSKNVVDRWLQETTVFTSLPINSGESVCEYLRRLLFRFDCFRIRSSDAPVTFSPG